MKARRRYMQSSHRALASVLAAGAMTAAALAVGGASPAAASSPILYAYAGGTATSPVSCPATGSTSQQCTLSEALALVPAGGEVSLATSGAAHSYYGNFSLTTSGTSSTAPVTIAPSSGVTTPTLDGDATAGVPCPTASCSGAVLTIGSGVNAVLHGLTIEDGDNTNTGNGGGIDDFGTTTVQKATIADCTAGDGGGVYVEDGAALTVTTSTLSSDTATSDGGAIDNGDSSELDTGNGTVTISGSTFSSDTAGNGGVIDNGDSGRNMDGSGNGTLTVTTSTFSGDEASNDGGAIDNGDDVGNGTVSVATSTFSSDSAAVNGGAIDNEEGACNTGSCLGSLTVATSTFSGDSASVNGGAIDNGDDSGDGSLTVTTSTFFGNSASEGGAIDNSAEGNGLASATITAATFDGNTASSAVIWDGDVPGVTIASSIVAKSTGVNCQGNIYDYGYNLEDDAGASCGFNAAAHDIVGSDPELAPLANNGGPTLTMLPSETSRVDDWMPSPTKVTIGGKQVTLCPAPDQRGVRPPDALAGCSPGSVDRASFDMPIVGSLTPSKGPAAGGNSVLIDGTNFVPGIVVRFGTLKATVTSVHKNHMTVTAPAFAGSVPATVRVTVTRPSGLTNPYRPGDYYTFT